MVDGSKACLKCGVVKPLDDFYRMASMSDGRRPSCKKCVNADQRRERACPVCGKLSSARGETCSQTCYRFLDDTVAKASEIPWRQCVECSSWFGRPNHSTVCGEECRTAARARWVTHRVKARRKCLDCGGPRNKHRAFCDVCRDHREALKLDKFIEWRRDNRAAYKAADRARRRGARTAEKVDSAYIFERDRFMCQLCKKRLAMKQVAPHPKAPTMDHIVPVSKGGLHEASNIQAAHFICNARKSAGGTDQLLLLG